MHAPKFDYIPLMGGSTAALGSISVTGVSTKHGDTKTDRGRLYLKLTKAGVTYTLSLHSAASRSDPSKVASGTTTALETFFDLAAANASGISASASISSYSADDSTMVAMVSFATDVDVFVQSGYASKMPGFDTNFGLAFFHSRAMREILTSALPRAVKFLYPAGIGLAAFVPTDPSLQLPDLTKLANADNLRLAQAALVKALSAEESEHLEEFAEMAEKSRARYEELIAALAEANFKDEQEGESAAGKSSVSVGTFIRG